MAYSQKFVSCIKVDGKVLREVSETVSIPFGSEFSILLRNLNTRRAQVNITIDGQDVLNGSSLIVDANGSLELERYLGDLNKGNRFKFIEKTSSVEAHRGNRPEDGLVRVSFKYEYKAPQYVSPGYNPNWNKDHLTGGYYGGLIGGVTNRALRSSNYNMLQPQNFAGTTSVCDGITVPGSVSDQKFTQVSGFVCDSEEFVIVIRLVGEKNGKNVITPVTVKTKPKCITCGKVNKATAKFCSECGTSLEIV